MRRSHLLTSFFITVTLLISVSTLLAQQGEKRPIPIEEYGRYRSISSVAISDDGQWISYAYTRREADDSLYVSNPDTGKEYLLPLASGARFSEDSAWLAYSLTVPWKEAEKLEEQKKPVPKKVELLNLETGEKTTWENGASFAFNETSTHFVVRKPKHDPKAKHGGTDLVLVFLNEDYEELIGGVSAYAFNKPGTVLTWTVDTADKDGNGLYAIFLDGGRRQVLDNDRLAYARMTWDEDGTAVAVLKGDEKKGFEEKENVLLAFTGFDDGSPIRHEFDPADADDFIGGMVVSEKGTISWNADATRVFFGIKEQKAKESEEPESEDEDEGDEEAGEDEDAEDEDPVADVDIWHWQDEQIQSVQMVRATRDRNRTHQSVFILATEKFNRLTDDEMRTISITRDGKWGVGQDGMAYISDWEERRADYYRVDIATGERTLMFEALGRTLGLSPDSEHFLYWQEGHVWDYILDTGATVNLTASAPLSFVDMEYDHPGTPPPYRGISWVEGGEAVILNHRYDLWLQPLDGSAATCLTNGVGAEQEIVFRYVQTDREERFVDLSQPILLTAFGQWTKKAGFYRLRRGRLTELLFEDRNFGRIQKAEEADRFLYTIQTFEQFPDYWVSGDDFSDRVRVTDANPQHAEYTWGHSILIDFTNNDGVRLQAWLGIPETRREGERLPMLVNYYEKNSQNLHRFQNPRYAGSPNLGGYLSNGYLVMQPDIHLRTRTTHSDMQECIEAAIKKVIELGYADPERIAVHGHSFSGQGSAYISTHSDMFAAIVYGAGATNLVSDFNQLWKTSGTNQHRYDIYGQGRFGTNIFDDLDLYIEQSAIYHARDMNTPLLILHGTADGSVEWLQGVEFYNALRFNDKPVILLSYPGAGHGLRKYENQLDFQRRTRQFLNHYLKDEPAADWMTDGQRFIDKPKKK